MSEVELKHERIVAVLETEIRSGRVRRGTRLPGEAALARRFAVSRTTIRSALAELGEAGLISTRTGKGSFASFEGGHSDTRHGWARALTDRGVPTVVKLLGIEVTAQPQLAARLGMAEDRFIVVTRVRKLAGGSTVSYERSCLPSVPELAHIVSDGLAGGSLTLTLNQAGLYESRGQQRVRARAISTPEALLMDREPDEWFLDVERTGWTEAGQLTEHVVSLLDPRHFEVDVEWNR